MKINTKIALSFMTIVGTLTAVVGVTFAAFSDSNSLTGNTLSTTTPNLEISTDTCSSFSTSPKSGVSSSNLAPGESGTRNFCLKNASSGDISFDISAVVTITTGALDPSLVTLTIDCSDIAVHVTGALNTFPSGNFLTLPAGTTNHCVITQTLSSSATNTSAGQSVQYDVAFNGVQH